MRLPKLNTFKKNTHLRKTGKAPIKTKDRKSLNQAG